MPLNENLIAEALKYGTCCQGISQFYLPPMCLSKAGPHLPISQGWKAKLALSWLVK